jgi:serine/threonine protein kinase/WD40 repeat protein
MSTSSSESRSSLVLEMAEEFLDRYRAGLRPALKDYIDRHPDLAAEIREVFPAMAMMENIALADESLAGDPTGGAPSTPASASRPELIGDFRVLREVGRGGMGVVYEAEQISLARHVALKVLPPVTLKDARQRQRFEREARAAAKLHHTNIVPVFGVGEHRGTPYYAMQFIQGQGLDAVLDELRRIRGDAVSSDGRTELATIDQACVGGRDVAVANVARSLMTGRFDSSRSDPIGAEDDQALSATQAGEPISREPTMAVAAPARGHASASSSLSLPGGNIRGKKRRETYWQGIARIGAQVADALAYAHAQGIVHRDIKPSNLLLDTRGTIWVADFGLAKVDDQQGLTHTGDVLGTLRFMPPEAFAGKTGAPGDIYSLGLTLYEMLAFRPAFNESDRGRLIKQVSESQPPRLGKLSREVPRDLETIVHKAIERQPEDRYGSARELAADLERYLDDQPILARRASLVERYARWARHHPEIAILGAVLTAVLLAATIGSIVAASRFRDQARRQLMIANENDVARKHAETRRVEAETARAEADEARLHAETVVVDMHVSNGLFAAERNDAARAMLWFARAAELARHDPEREQVNRVRARAWEREAVVPVLALEHRGRNVAHLSFQPVGDLLLTINDDGTAYLRRTIDGSEVPFPGSNKGVGSAAWSPDGTRLAVGLAGCIVVVRVADGATVHQLECPGPITAVAFSSKGMLLAGGSRRARVWNMATGKAVGPELVHPGALSSLEFSPQANQLLSSCSDQIARVFDIPSPDGLPRLQSTQFLDRGAAGYSEYVPRFSARGDAILCATDRQELTWLHASTGRATGPGKVTLGLSYPKAIAVSHDGRWFAAGGYYGPELFPVDRADGQPRLLTHANGVTSCEFSPDSKLLVSSSLDRTVRLWTVPDGRALGAPLPHEQVVEGAAFAPDGRHLATWQRGGVVRIWRLPVADRAVAIPNEVSGSALLRKSRDGRRAIRGKFHNAYDPDSLGCAALAVYDIDSGRTVGTPISLADEVHDAALDSRGARGAAVTQGPKGSFFHVWNVATGQAAFAPRPLAEPGISIAFDPDDRLVAAISNNGTIKVFDSAVGHIVSHVDSPAHALDRAANICFSCPGKLVAHFGGDVRVVEATTGRLLVPPIHAHLESGFTSAFTVSNDGRYVAVGASNGSNHVVRIWDLTTGKSAGPGLAHPDAPYVLNFTSDGSRLLSGSRDGGLRCWDWSTGRLAAPNCAADDEIFDLAILPGSAYAVTGVRRKMHDDTHGNLDVWDLASGKRLLPTVRVGPESVHGLAISADGRHALAFAYLDRVYAVDLSDAVEPDSRPTAELVRLGELASGQRIVNGDLAGLTTDEWMSRWRVAPPQFWRSAGAALVIDRKK